MGRAASRRIDTFVVGSNGKAGPAVSHPSSDGFPFGFAFDNKGHLIVSNINEPGMGTDDRVGVHLQPSATRAT